MPRLDAPSISTTSTWLPMTTLRHCSQVLHGSAVGAFSQFSALARMRAMVVLPTPRVPLNR